MNGSNTQHALQMTNAPPNEAIMVVGTAVVVSFTATYKRIDTYMQIRASATLAESELEMASDCRK